MSISELLDAAGALVEGGATPACQVAVARDDELLCFETFGAATNESRFCVWSATKPIVASAVWVLIGDGLLDTNARSPTTSRSSRPTARRRSPSSRCSSIRQGSPNAPMDAVEGADTVTRVKRFTEWELEWEPGSRFEYHALVGALGARGAARTPVR